MFRFLLLSFINNITLGAIGPYTQIILRNKGYSFSLVGVVYALGQVSTCFFPLLIGALVDRTRKSRSTMMALMLLQLALLVPTMVSGSVWLTALCLFLSSGFLWSVTPVFDAYLERQLDGDTQKYGIIRAAGTSGYVIFMVLCALSGFPDGGNNSSILLCNIIAGLVFVLACIPIPKDLPAEQPQVQRKKGSEIRLGRSFYLLMFIVGLTRISEAAIDKLLSSYMTEVLGLGRYFTLFVALGAACEFLMLIFGGRLLEKGRVSCFFMIALSAVGLTVRLLTYVFFRNIIAFSIAQTLHALTFGALHIGMMEYMARNVDKEHYSYAMGFYWAIACNLPSTVGTFAGGFLIDGLGYDGLFGIYSVFPAVAFVLMLVFRKVLAGDDVSVLSEVKS